jgi:phosphinothricin acetyltransferase
MIRPVRLNDAAAVAAIYNYYVENTAVTFEETPVAPMEMAARIEKIAARFPWLVLEDKQEIIGYAYAHNFHERSGWRFTVEDAIYIKQGAEQRGYGRELLRHLLEELRRREVHAVIACLGLPNVGSVKLHEQFGFRQTGFFPEVGYKFGARRDVGYWQLLLTP